MAKRAESKYVLSVEDQTKRALNEIKGGFRSVERTIMSLKGLGTGAIGGLIGYETVQAVKDTSRELADLGREARLLKWRPDELDAWHYAAAQARVGAEAFDASLARLHVRLYAAEQGSKAHRDAMQYLGIELRNQEGAYRSNTDLLLQFSAGLEESTDRGRALAAMNTLLGPGFENIALVLDGGTASLKRHIVEAYALGARYEDLVKKGEQAEASQLRISRAWRTMKDSMIGPVLPSFAYGLEEIADNIVTAVTGLDREWRTFLAGLQILPPQTALDTIRQKSEDLRAELAQLRRDHADAIAEVALRNADTLQGGSRDSRNYLDLGTRTASKLLRAAWQGLTDPGGTQAAERVAEITAELERLEAAEQRAKDAQEQLRKQTEESKAAWEAEQKALEAARRATEEKSRADAEAAAHQKRLAGWVQAATPAWKVFADELKALDAAFRAGEISGEVYTANVEALTEKAREARLQLAGLGDAEARRTRYIQEAMPWWEREQEAIKQLTEDAIALNLPLSVFVEMLARIRKEAEEARGGTDDMAKAGSQSMEVLKDAARDAAEGIADSIGWAVMESENLLEELGDVAKRVFAQIISGFIKLGLVKLIPGLGPILFPGGIPGKKALGGPVWRGRPYVVGEREPEMFWPSEDGTIVPETRILAALARRQVLRPQLHLISGGGEGVSPRAVPASSLSLVRGSGDQRPDRELVAALGAAVAALREGAVSRQTDSGAYRVLSPAPAMAPRAAATSPAPRAARAGGGITIRGPLLEISGTVLPDRMALRRLAVELYEELDAVGRTYGEASSG